MEIDKLIKRLKSLHNALKEEGGQAMSMTREEAVERREQK
uniref:Uncharacterized protein n=1 Tax=Siphoviridae sp. ctsIQ24 TaxID=2826484 RepID=A0A8S5MPM6_9CAUD|nr:MAG TPA: hypothetical protein [Siphoviridae sp. ctsIQ24]